MKIEELRITKLKEYLINAVNEIREINVDILSKNVGSYSLDKIPVDINVERWIDGTEIHKDVFSFKSRRNYSYDQMNNLANIGFFETFEALIKNKNRQRDLPQIEGIRSIECLNCGTLNNANTNTAEFDIQIQITYKVKEELYGTSI